MIYVCIPSRNEAGTLGPLLWKVQKVFRAFGREFRIVVLDDASDDDTQEILDRYSGLLPLEVLTSERPVGYGAAVDRLLRHVVQEAPYPKRDAAVILQADLTEDPENLVELVKILEGGSDVVAGSMAEVDDASPAPVRWGRRLAPWVMGSAYRNAPVEDPLCGLRAYRVIVLKKAVRDDQGPLASSPEPWAASVELLRRTVPHARRVDDVPLSLRYGLLIRESRFRALPVLKRLFRLRSPGWTTVPEREQAA